MLVRAVGAAGARGAFSVSLALVFALALAPVLALAPGWPALRSARAASGVPSSSAGASSAAPAAAVASVEETLLAWTNRDRAAQGLQPLRLDRRLAGIAAERATRLTTMSTFSHDAAGDLAAALARADVQWYAWAEDIGWWQGGGAAAALYAMWRSSPSHWANLMSADHNYVGFGIARRASDGRTFASVVFTESSDHSAPRAAMTGASRSGTTVTFTWRAWDLRLQSHESGVRDVEAWYRVDAGAWRLLRAHTTATSLRLTGRAPGHRYSLAVRPRDRAGNVGPLSATISIRVP